MRANTSCITASSTVIAVHAKELEIIWEATSDDPTIEVRSALASFFGLSEMLLFPVPTGVFVIDGEEPQFRLPAASAPVSVVSEDESPIGISSLLLGKSQLLAKWNVSVSLLLEALFTAVCALSVQWVSAGATKTSVSVLLACALSVGFALLAEHLVGLVRAAGADSPRSAIRIVVSKVLPFLIRRSVPLHGGSQKPPAVQAKTWREDARTALGGFRVVSVCVSG